MRWWEESVGGPVRGRIVALLRRGERSVEELADALGLTDNAVRAHLKPMEERGLVHRSRIRRAGTVGKPAQMYAIPPAAEPLFSTAYAPVLRALLASLNATMSDSELDELFRDVGRRLSTAWRTDAGKSRGAKRSLEARAHDAADLLTSLGAEIDVERTPNGFLLRGHACPLSGVVGIQPRVCHAVTHLVSAGAGVAVRQCCDRSGGDASAMRCCFEVRRSA